MNRYPTVDGDVITGGGGRDMSGGTGRYPDYRKPCGVSLVMRKPGPCSVTCTV